MMTELPTSPDGCAYTTLWMQHTSMSVCSNHSDVSVSLKVMATARMLSMFAFGFDLNLYTTIPVACQ